MYPGTRPYPGLDEIRRHVLLPSDCLDIARKKNPGVEIELVARSGVLRPAPGSAFVLRVTTKRGVLEYEKGPFENWSDVFRRAELL